MAPVTTKVETKGFKIWLEPSMIERLHEQAARFGRKSGNEISSEIIVTYLEFWVRSEEGKRTVVNEQRERVGLDIQSGGNESEQSLKKSGASGN